MLRPPFNAWSIIFGLNTNSVICPNQNAWLCRLSKGYWSSGPVGNPRVSNIFVIDL